MKLSNLRHGWWGACLSLTLLHQPAAAFCGFYVAQADAQLFNEASQVVLVRDGDRTVVTMASDYQGTMDQFALVVPVPTVLQKEQVHVTNQAILDHLDAYTAPRLVEYFDDDPCQRSNWGAVKSLGFSKDDRVDASMPEGELRQEKRVRIEATYTVGEYDILILSAEESGGLQSWLEENGYQVPAGASRVLSSYLKQGMKFFVAKVNLAEQRRTGVQNLRPLQMAFESEKFMLPIRLGTINSSGTQEMFVYTLTRTGRVETTNYRTIKIPSDVTIPEYVEDDFGGFYSAMFDRECEKASNRGVFLEYAWDMNWCDPCAADPLSSAELLELGVFWTAGSERDQGFSPKRQARDVFVTRLHVRYDGDHFPEDLMFHETGDRSNFQGRYVVQHAWAGEPSCDNDEVRAYYRDLHQRQGKEAKTLARLTGWELADIHRDMNYSLVVGGQITPWWKSIWKN